MLSRLGRGNQRDRLADDDAEDTGNALGLYRVKVARDDSARRRRREDIGHEVAEIYDERPSPVLPLESLSSVLRQSICCPANVECEVLATTGERPLRIGSLRCGPNFRMASQSKSKAHWRLSVDCVSSALAPESIASPAARGFNEAESHRLR